MACVVIVVVVVWWCGGLVVWWCGGLVVWWCGGELVKRAKNGSTASPVLKHVLPVVGAIIETGTRIAYSAQC